MPVLEGAGVHHVVDAVENLVPLAFVLLDRNGLLLGQLAAAGHDGLLAVDPRGDESGQPVRNLLALLAHRMEGADGPLRGAADLAADIPAAETLVAPSVHVPHLVDHILVVLDLVRHVVRVPVLARVVEAEIELHAVFLGQPQEEVDQIDRRHVAPLFEQIGRGVGDELAVSRTDDDHRVDADGLHVAEIGLPLLRTPVLVGNVVRDFVEERARDAEPALFGDDQVACALGRSRL